MKRLFLFVGFVLALSNLWAQKQVKGVVTDRKGEPVVGASVSVKGTSISTVTDLDGRFVIDNVPEEARRIEVKQIGMSSTSHPITADGTEMLIVLKPGERRFTPFVQAGVNLSRLMDTGFKPKVGYSIGAGFSIACSDLFSISPSVNFVQLNYKEDTEHSENVGPIYYINQFNPTYLQIPVMLDLKMWISNNEKVVISVGPYVAFGLNGTYQSTYKSGEWMQGMAPTETEFEMDLFKGEQPLFKKSNVGIQLGLQYQTRHLSIGMDLQAGLGAAFDSASGYTTYDSAYPLCTTLKVGYRF